MSIKPGEIYLVGRPQFIGAYPLRQQIEVLPADELIDWQDMMVIGSDNSGLRKAKFKLGWIVKETTGMAVVNPRGVTSGKKSTVIGNK